MCFLTEKKRIIGYNNIDNDNENSDIYYNDNKNNENDDDANDTEWTKSCGLGVGTIAPHMKYQI